MRFDFGQNWVEFSKHALDAKKVLQAREHFHDLMAGIPLRERSFLDIGFGQVKVCLKNGEEPIKTLCFPRIFAQAKLDNWGLNDHSIYGIGGDRFFVGREALSYQDSLICERRPGSAEV